MAQNIPIEFQIAVAPAPAVELSALERAVQRKLAMAGREAELTLEEFAAYRGVLVEQVRKNLSHTRGVCRTSQKAVGIHLGTYLAENFKMAGGWR